MTKNTLKSIIPDSITGMIFALEGMKDTVVLLNGPMGCKFYHSTTSQFLSIRPVLYLPTEDAGKKMPVDTSYLNDWFFRQERVPCTYLDGYDYVYGTRDKVSEALRYISDNVSFDILAIVNSPGAALIGDNLLMMARQLLGGRCVVMLESPGYSSSFEEGYSNAARAILEQVGPLEKDVSATAVPNGIKGVNILGLSIWNRYCYGDIMELRRLFGLCGIDVISTLCADCSIDQLRTMPRAELNVVLSPETGLDAAEFLQEKYGTPFYVCNTLPIGFDATEKMYTDICSTLCVCPDKLLEDSGRARGLAWYKINQEYRSYGKPRGVKYHVKASPFTEDSYRAFLTGYLGMEHSEPEHAELVFSDANLISELMLQNHRFCGIEISLPGMGYTDLIPKTHMGVMGALFLTEQVLNGLMSKL